MRVLYIPHTYTANADSDYAFSKFQEHFEGRITFEHMSLPSAAHDLQSRPSASSPSFKEVSQFIKNMDWNYDFIIGQGYGGMLWTVLSRHAEIKIPAFIVPHLNPVDKRSLLIALLLASCQCSQDRLLAGCRTSTQLFKTLGLQAIPHYPFGIYTDFFYHDIPREQLLNDLELPDGTYLIYAGRLNRDKSIAMLLSIYLKISILYPDCHLLLVSHDIDEAYMEDMSEIIRQHDKIHLVTNPSIQNLNKYYNLATLYISTATSYFETFGRGPVEAMVCGTPPVVPEYDGFRDTVTPEAGILVPTRWSTDNGFVVDDSEFVRQIYELLSTPQKLNPMSTAAIDRGRQFYTDRVITIFDSLFQSEKKKNIKYRKSETILPDYLPDFIQSTFSDLGTHSPEKCLELLFNQFASIKTIKFTPEEWSFYYQKMFRHF